MPPRRPPTEAWPNGSTRAWRKVREQVLKRDGRVCQLRLDGCTYRATAVHHTAGRQVTGDNPRYLVAACQPCNTKVGDPTKPRGSGGSSRKQNADPPCQPRTIW